ncbi:MAG: DUF1232 domain-containing protein [Chloroflexi bacterium]|jgi:hypothetical protein|nr:DUF1232 domain-containing protein [Chloroflexota bacterium]MBT3670216.1 DUF1232 domain-containing protein [Chloroflexota bacterium]MBT4003746.1 DUF1232 domain-containing protein [Chloroflexota bacterium]MBT4306110.1 DUF1232 domain-containing protein [Chloroflexota bacterium]MBT4534490.1 DUF1232 domain-containing protein [Chloroflexota bacterium]
MTEEREQKKSIINNNPGMVKNLSLQARLILRLLRDRRVSFLAKLLPIGSLIYLLSPDLVPFILDDAAVIGVGTYMFMELCPPGVVEEHRKELWGEVSDTSGQANDDILDAEFLEQDK